eukprot:scaffold191356_cov28-Tisochrysis_lutea.AAC.2
MASRKPSSDGVKHSTKLCTPPLTATPAGTSSDDGSIISNTWPSIPTTASVSCSIPHSSPRKEVDRRSTCVRQLSVKQAASALRPWHNSSAYRRLKLAASSNAALLLANSRDVSRVRSLAATAVAPPSLNPRECAAGAPRVTVGHTAPNSALTGPSLRAPWAVPDVSAVRPGVADVGSERRGGLSWRLTGIAAMRGSFLAVEALKPARSLPASTSRPSRAQRHQAAKAAHADGVRAALSNALSCVRAVFPLVEMSTDGGRAAGTLLTVRKAWI